MQDSLLDPVAAADVAPEMMVGGRRARDRARVTVIDDSPDFLELIEDVLGSRHDVVTCRVVHSVSELAATEPDLLVIDLHCGGPAGGLTGWDIVAAVRSHPALRDIPAIVCSADLAALREDRISLIAYGDVQLVAKPFDLAAFEQVVERTLRLANGPRPAPLEDADYPPLDMMASSFMAGSFREGRPLRMCPHGRVMDQGDYCSRCG